MSTAVWMVMCKEPVMRAPRSGCCAANSCRMAIKPGISVSAMRISLRPQSARLKSLTKKSWGCLMAAFIADDSVRRFAPELTGPKRPRPKKLVRDKAKSCGARRLEFGRERARLVGALPRELRFLAAEMSVGRGLLINGPRQIQHFAQAKGREIEMRTHQLRQARI